MITRAVSRKISKIKYEYTHLEIDAALALLKLRYNVDFKLEDVV
mgnify:CR=1 FL=1|jgi:hypothetical protein